MYVEFFMKTKCLSNIHNIFLDNTYIVTNLLIIRAWEESCFKLCRNDCFYAEMMVEKSENKAKSPAFQWEGRGFGSFIGKELQS